MSIADLDKLFSMRDRRLLVRPQVLALTAAGKHAFPRSSCDEFASAMDDLVACLVDGRSTALGVGRDAIVFDWRVPSALGERFPEPSPEWRNLALHWARRLWEYAIATTVASRAGEGWSSTTQGVWRSWRHAGSRVPEQGWKLHVAATTLSAPAVLEACAGVLTSGRSAFKHAATLGDLEALTARAVVRSQGGKFITVYPEDASEARDLASRLHEATKGLSGPRILSDMPFCGGSLVHYRYGVCSRPRALADHGGYEDQLRDPSGAMVADERNAWYSKPPWVEPLFAEQASPGPERASSSLLADRYRITGAIRHSYRGSVFRGLDTRTGEAVVVKQARPNTVASFVIPDAPDALRVEAQNLSRLAGVAPPLLDVFEQQGHLFMAQAAVQGVSLSKYVERTLDPTGGPAATAVRPFVTAICRLLGEVHRRGLVFRDFTPGNIMVEPDGRLWLIDAELLTTPDAVIERAFTPRFAAPEQVEAASITAGQGLAPDLYALGAVLYFVATGGPPPACVKGGDAETLRRRWRIAAFGLAERGCGRLAELVLQLTDPRPDARPSVAQVLEIIEDDAFWRQHQDVVGPDEEDRAWAAAALERLGEDGLGLVTVSAVSDEFSDISATGRGIDSCNAAQGAAGLLEYLCRIETKGSDGPQAAIRTLAERICAAMDGRDVLLSGLYYGAGGAAWATLSAAQRLGDEALGRRAMKLIERMPTHWHIPDIYHGAAGGGLALCRAWTYEPSDSIRKRIGEVADDLLSQMRTSDDGVYWNATESLNSKLAGVAQYGFGHGVAGIGAFLLSASAVTGRAEYLDVAVAAGDTLLRVAEPCACGSKWRSAVHPVGDEPGLSYYQCNGSAGVGSFLVRLWIAGGHGRHKAGAEAAARAAHGVRWHSGVTACCGLAGCGQLLLDMAEFVDDGYAAMARDVAEALLMHTVSRDGAIFVTDDPAGRLTVDYNDGLAGVLDFLGRLKSRGPRPWMVDELLPSSKLTSRTPLHPA